ncbi:DUF4998 domain-containing protein [Paradesertivirga mongoliensis]|uniref:DUF4998 domain-containing protein n=1 Tax=Paradesertivirga mongoliensis TaxID=2100740 RepID=A0ABW4ZJU5_9SPHI|nr:DUF4998 domain-containing protein [Pedobacter mongoliensis]
MKKIRYIRYFLILISVSGMVASCSKMDDNYGHFIKDGEKVYTGKAEALQALPGKNRIKLKWLLVSDPKINKAVVYWNSRADSMVVPIQRTTGEQEIEVIIPNLVENAYTFQVYTYDNAGNRSIMVETIGTAYGENYEQTISNRPLDSTSFRPNNDLLLSWFGAGTQAVKVEVIYTDRAGAIKALDIKKQINPLNPALAPVWYATNILPNYDRTKSLKYRTGYLPETGAIDTFYTAYTEITDIRTYVPIPPPPADENLARAKPITTSGGSGTPLTDGNRTGSTRWQPGSGERGDLNVWFYVDLGSVKEFNTTQLYISKDPNKITYYEVLTSEESSVGTNTKWKRAYIKFGAPEEEDIFYSKDPNDDTKLVPLKARFIKINVGLRDADTNINIAELEVYKFAKIP